MKLLILGATGLVGQQVLQQALADPDIEQIVAPTRRPLPVAVKLINPVIDFECLPTEADWWQADGIILALGTTLRQTGSRAAYRRVDYDYCLQAARCARSHGTPGCALVSSLGADAVITSYSIHYTKLYDDLNLDAEESYKFAIILKRLRLRRPSSINT